jgi:hypothetical protein
MRIGRTGWSLIRDDADFSPNPSNDDTEKPAPTPSLPSTGTLRDMTRDQEASSTSITIENGAEPDANSPKSISKFYRSSLLNFSLWALGIAMMVAAAVLRLYDEDGVLTTDTLRCRLAIAAPSMNFLSLLLTMYNTCRILRLADREGLEKWLSFR